MNHQLNLYNRESSLSQEEIFYSLLGRFPGYPFCEEKEKRVFSYFFKLWPQVDYVSLLKRQLDYWEKHPEALRKNPRKELKEFLQSEMWDALKDSDLKAIEEESNKAINGN